VYHLLDCKVNNQVALQEIGFLESARALWFMRKASLFVLSTSFRTQPEVYWSRVTSAVVIIQADQFNAPGFAWPRGRVITQNELPKAVN
jgi:hypothetical protein